MPTLKLPIRTLVLAALLASLQAGWPVVGHGGVDSLHGSFVAFDPAVGGDACLVPTTAQTFCFRTESFTNDWDWATAVWLRFPFDWAITDVYVQGAPVCDLGEVGPLTWQFWHGELNEVHIYQERMMGPEDHCMVTYCIDLNSGAAAADAGVSWYWMGDEYGAPPYHPCSLDQYHPAGRPACDEAVQPLASVPYCALPEGLYLTPDAALGEGCSGQSQPATFFLTNRTGAAAVFALSYSVTAGTGVLTGPLAVTAADRETVSFDVELTPDLCALPGYPVRGLIDAAGNGFSAEAIFDVKLGLGGWELAAPLPAATAGQVVVAAADPADGLDYVYVLGSSVEQAFRYDPRTDSWTNLASPPQSIGASGDGAAYEGHIYIRTDGQGAVTNALLDYDISADAWTVTLVPDAIDDRADYEAAELGGWIYFVGGALMPAYVMTSEVDRYDPVTGTWQTVAPLLHARSAAASWAYHGRIYVAGGSDDSLDLLSTEVYDPTSDTWAEDPGQFAALPDTWAAAADAVLGDRLWVAGGYYGWGATARTAYWTAGDNVWHEGPSLAQPVVQAEGAELLGRMVVPGGLSGGLEQALNQQLVGCPACSRRSFLFLPLVPRGP